ncbi:unnamed protein product [Symbiodinium sp. CCMP2456]|nr:unnamed protein product [Symbiodinium sp. CCMP2456]
MPLESKASVQYDGYDDEVVLAPGLSLGNFSSMECPANHMRWSELLMCQSNFDWLFGWVWALVLRDISCKGCLIGAASGFVWIQRWHIRMYPAEPWTRSRWFRTETTSFPSTLHTACFGILFTILWSTTYWGSSPVSGQMYQSRIFAADRADFDGGGKTLVLLGFGLMVGCCFRTQAGFKLWQPRTKEMSTLGMPCSKLPAVFNGRTSRPWTSLPMAVRRSLRGAYKLTRASAGPAVHSTLLQALRFFIMPGVMLCGLLGGTVYLLGIATLQALDGGSCHISPPTITAQTTWDFLAMAEDSPVEDNLVSDGSTASAHPNSPPRGPPPPQPIQVIGEASLSISVAVGSTIQFLGGGLREILTHLPSDWRTQEGMVVELRSLLPSDRFHPHMMWIGEGTPQSALYPAGGPSTTPMPGAALATEEREDPTGEARATDEEMTDAVQALEADGSLDELLMDIPRGVEVEMARASSGSSGSGRASTWHGSSAPPPPTPATTTGTRETNASTKPRAKPRKKLFAVMRCVGQDGSQTGADMCLGAEPPPPQGTERTDYDMTRVRFALVLDNAAGGRVFLSVIADFPHGMFKQLPSQVRIDLLNTDRLAQVPFAPVAFPSNWTADWTQDWSTNEGDASLSRSFRRQVMVWMQDEESQGRAVDILCLQETAWQGDSEFVTADIGRPGARWYAVHTGAKDKSGVMCLVRSNLIPPDGLRHRVVLAGRLLHVRLMLGTPLDLLCMYQEGDTLCRPLAITPDEVWEALGKISPSKAMPSWSAPAAVWKVLRSQLLPTVVSQLNQVLQTGPLILPPEWCTSELVLIPKPGKSLTSVGQLRPICLLPPMAKTLATILANRMQPYLQSYLQEVAQYAYVPGRSLSQALERAISHCVEVRALLATQGTSLYERRGGGTRLPVVGGIMLSLDITGAYDVVRRETLLLALQAAAVPAELRETVMAVHNQAKIRISHCGHEDTIALGTGLRQGCGLSPALWALVSGWLLRGLNVAPDDMPAEVNTSYADDLLFKWIIRSGKALEVAYRQIRTVLEHLADHGLQVSTAKTVTLVELRGTKAHHALRKYVVSIKGVRHMRFQVRGRDVDLRLVDQHVYLGAIISYRKPEQATVQHRMTLAKGQFARLKPVLKCQAVPGPPGAAHEAVEGLYTGMPFTRT